ncbi:hypothetical protein D3C86_1065120 [compost metagenome]
MRQLATLSLHPLLASASCFYCTADKKRYENTPTQGRGLNEGAEAIIVAASALTSHRESDELALDIFDIEAMGIEHLLHLSDMLGAVT